jgi:hypothetical protein
VICFQRLFSGVDGEKLIGSLQKLMKVHVENLCSRIAACRDDALAILGVGAEKYRSLAMEDVTLLRIPEGPVERSFSLAGVRPRCTVCSASVLA